MGKALALICMGFSFALVGLGNIMIAMERHIPIFEPLQWLCLEAFVVFVLSGVAVAILEVPRQS